MDDGINNPGIGVMPLRVDILTIESGKRKSLFKVDKTSSYEARGTIILDDKDCVVLDIKFPVWFLDETLQRFRIQAVQPPQSDLLP